MSVKMSGAEYLAFVGSDWGQGQYWDDTAFKWNGVEIDNIDQDDIAPGDAIVLLSGTIFRESDTEFRQDAVDFFNAWRRERETITLAVEVKKADTEAFSKMLEASGYARVIEFDRKSSKRVDSAPGM